MVSSICAYLIAVVLIQREGDDETDPDRRDSKKPKV